MQILHEKLQLILRTHKLRSSFYTGNTLRKLPCKLKHPVATEDKSHIVYEINCSYSEAVFFGKSRRSLKSRSDEHRRFVENFYNKTEISKYCREEDHYFCRE